MKKNFAVGLMVLSVGFVFSGAAMAHEGMEQTGDGTKQCDMAADKAACDLKKDKHCEKGCKKPCCYHAKTNFTPGNKKSK